MSALPGSAEGTAVTGLDSSPVEPAAADLPPLTEQTRLEAREIIARYPVARSALLPMLHLVQSYQGYVSPEGVALCAEELGLTKAEVGAVATFYTMYKRRPTGRHIVSVCTNTLCTVLGGQRICDALSADLGVHHDETDGRRLDHPRARRVPGRLRLRAGGHRRLRVLRPAGRRERPRAGRGAAPRREAAAHPRRPADRLPRHLPPAGRLLPVRRTPPPAAAAVDAAGALGPTLRRAAAGRAARRVRAADGAGRAVRRPTSRRRARRPRPPGVRVRRSAAPPEPRRRGRWPTRTTAPSTTCGGSRTGGQGPDHPRPGPGSTRRKA